MSKLVDVFLKDRIDLHLIVKIQLLQHANSQPFSASLIMKVTMKLILRTLLLASLAAPADSSPAPACSICPEGSVLGHPTLGLPLSADDLTCGFLDSQLGQMLAASEMCATSRSELSIFFDLPAFCGCSGVTPSGGCSFCGPDDLVLDPERQVGAFDDDGFDDDRGIFESPPTCGDFVTLAQFVIDPTACGDISGLVPLCCEAARVDSEAAPANSEAGNSTNDAPFLN